MAWTPAVLAGLIFAGTGAFTLCKAAGEAVWVRKHGFAKQSLPGMLCDGVTRLVFLSHGLIDSSPKGTLLCVDLGTDHVPPPCPPLSNISMSTFPTGFGVLCAQAPRSSGFV